MITFLRIHPGGKIFSDKLLGKKKTLFFCPYALSWKYFYSEMIMKKYSTTRRAMDDTTWCNAKRCWERKAGGRQHRGCIISQAVTHSLALLKMGKIIALNLLSWLELLINRYCCIYLVVYIIYISLYFFETC